jgi:hypothetical protein
VAITNAIGLNTSWQPIASGWVSSISAGWGYTPDNDTQALAIEAAAPGFSLQSAVSQSLSVGLRWVEAFVKRNTFGMAVAQATVITTSKVSGSVPNDAGDAWEWWHKVQITDQISITPTIGDLGNPCGEVTDLNGNGTETGSL